MRLTEDGRAIAWFSKLKPEHAVLAGMCGVSLTNWGGNIFNSQAYVMTTAALAMLALMTRDGIVAAFGIYAALWFVYQQIAVSMGWLDSNVLIQAVDSLMLIMAGLALYIAVRNGRLKLETYLRCLCSLAAVLAGIGLLTFAGKGVAVATLGNQNFLGAFLAVSGVGIYRLKGKWLWLLIPICGCLLATKTSTAIAAFLIATGFYFLGWIGAWTGGILGVAYLACFKGYSSLLDRITLWQDAVEKVGNHWNTIIFGTGPGIYWQSNNMLHSEYAYLLWNFGLIGLALAALYIIRAFRSVDDRVTLAMFLAVLVDGIGNHLMHTPPTAGLAVIVFALMDRPRRPFGSRK